MENNKNKSYIFLIVGPFGCGKTSIVNFYEHKDYDGVSTSVHGLVSLGGKRGGDECTKAYNMSKKEIYDRHIWGYNDYIIHGAVMTQKIDILRYMKTHNLIVFCLDITEENLKERMLARNPKAKWNPKSYLRDIGNMDRFYALCNFKKVPVYLIDNNRTLEEVAKDVWSKIDSFRICGKLSS